MIRMSLSDALDYSVGRYVTALEKSRGSNRDAIHNANWTDVAISLRSSIDQLPAKGRKAMYAHTASWDETESDSDLECGLASASALVAVIQSHWDEHHTACEACDRVKGALEDAHASIADLLTAMMFIA